MKKCPYIATLPPSSRELESLEKGSGVKMSKNAAVTQVHFLREYRWLLTYISANVESVCLSVGLCVCVCARACACVRRRMCVSLSRSFFFHMPIIL